MKKLTAILFSVLMLLPSIGVHLDFEYCCGNLEEIGVAHQLELDLSSCCDESHKKTCMEETEIIQAPTQLTFINSDPSLNLAPPLTGVHTCVYNSPGLLLTAIRPLQKPFHQRQNHPSVFQVFLC